MADIVMEGGTVSAVEYHSPYLRFRSMWYLKNMWTNLKNVIRWLDIRTYERKR